MQKYQFDEDHFFIQALIVNYSLQIKKRSFLNLQFLLVSMFLCIHVVLKILI